MLIIDFNYNATDAFYSAYKYGIKDCAPSSAKDAWACKGAFVLMDYNPFTHTSQKIREEYNKLTVSLLKIGQTIPNGCCELPPTDGSMNPILLACEFDQKPWCRYYSAKSQVWKHTHVPASYPGGLDSVYSELEEPTTAPTASPTQGPPSTSYSSATQSQGSANSQWTKVALVTAGLGALLGGGIYARRRSLQQQELQKANHPRSISNR